MWLLQCVKDVLEKPVNNLYLSVNLLISTSLRLSTGTQCLKPNRYSYNLALYKLYNILRLLLHRVLYTSGQSCINKLSTVLENINAVTTAKALFPFTFTANSLAALYIQLQPSQFLLP